MRDVRQVPFPGAYVARVRALESAAGNQVAVHDRPHKHAQPNAVD